MADLTTGQNIGTNTGAGISVARGSGDGGAAGAAIGINAAADLVNIFSAKNRADNASASAGSATAIRIQEREQAGKVVASYITEANKIANAVRSGAMPSSEGASRVNSKFQEYLVANEYYAKDLMEAHGDFVSTSALGKVISTGTPEEKLREEMVKEATTAGYGDDPDKYFQMKRDSENFRYLSTRQEYLNSQIESNKLLTEAETARLRNEQARIEIEADRALVNVIGNGVSDFDKTLGSLLQQHGQTPVAVAAIEERYAAAREQVMQNSANASPEKVELMLKMLENKYNVHLQVANGQLDRTSYENQLAVGEAVDALALREANPVTGRLIVLGKLAGPGVADKLVSDPKVLSSLTNAVLGVADPKATPAPPGALVPMPVDENTSDSAQVKRDNEAKRSMHKLLSHNMSRYDRLSEDEKEHLVEGMGRVLDNYVAYPVQPGQPERYEFLLDMMSDTKNGPFWVKNHDSLQGPGKKLEELMGSYGRDLHTAIDGEFSATRGLEISFTGGDGGIRFTSQGFDGTRPDPGYKKTYPGMPFDAREQEYYNRYPERAPGVDYEQVRTAKRMNDKAAPLLNRFIRAWAHANGTMNYAETWENEVKPYLFNKQPGEALVSGVEEVDSETFFKEVDF